MGKRGKKGQSAVVATVLLILLVIVAVIAVFGFVVPFVKEKLTSGDCLDVIGKIEISSGYTCYDSDSGEMQVQVHVGEIRELIDGFSIELGGATTKNYKIRNDSVPSEVSMCGGDVELPGNNEERTYIIPVSEKPDVIKVYPILTSGKLCGASDIVTGIDVCSFDQKCI